MKILLGITPQGTICYVSETWGGRVSDKFITEHCGILNKLTPGDVVLADRGFDISDSVGLMQATLHIPAFTKGKGQLSALEVHETSKRENSCGTSNRNCQAKVFYFTIDSTYTVCK